MNRLPFQWRVALGTALGASVALVLFALTTWFTLRPWLWRLMDEELADEARELAALYATPGDDEAFWREHAWLGWRVVGDDGGVQPGGLHLSDDVAVRARDTSHALDVWENGQHWRVRSFRLEGGETLVVGRNIGSVDGLLAGLLRSYAYGLPGAVVVIALVASWVGRLSLRPLARLAAETGNIGAENVTGRVAVPLANDELRRVALSFNALLDRMQAALGQARNFAGDASHELRTPLTVMRGEVEALLREPAAADLRVRLASLEEEIARLDRITGQLLQLARLDAGRGLIGAGELDFSALVRDVTEDAELLATARGVRLETALAPHLKLRGDPDHLRRLLFNLLDNATRYNRPGGYVRVALADVERAAVLMVSNQGDRIPPEAQARLFERFFRARPGGEGPLSERGSGLGLSLAREIARAHGGELRLASTTAQETSFELRLPVLD